MVLVTVRKLWSLGSNTAAYHIGLSQKTSLRSYGLGGRQPNCKTYHMTRNIS
jgi:hypothetical protein